MGMLRAKICLLPEGVHVLDGFFFLSFTTICNANTKQMSTTWWRSDE